MNNVGEVAFTKIDNTLINGIAPYNENEAIDFSMPYLSGFFAEQYDIEKDDITPKVEDRVSKYSKSLEWNYTLLPTWILTYLYKDKTYVYAVNGQTGKSFGELPFDSSKAFKVSIIIFAIIFIILLLGGIFIW